MRTTYTHTCVHGVTCRGAHIARRLDTQSEDTVCVHRCTYVDTGICIQNSDMHLNMCTCVCMFPIFIYTYTCVRRICAFLHDSHIHVYTCMSIAPSLGLGRKPNRCPPTHEAHLETRLGTCIVNHSSTTRKLRFLCPNLEQPGLGALLLWVHGGIVIVNWRPWLMEPHEQTEQRWRSNSEDNASTSLVALSPWPSRCVEKLRSEAAAQPGEQADLGYPTCSLACFWLRGTRL